jgi:hypothetical protein
MSNTRAAQRRARKASLTTGVDAPQDQIQLQNPVAEHHAAFIFGNAQYCDRVVEQDSAKGETLVICGAGPSLAEDAGTWCRKGDQVWGCNSAMPWLVAQGYPVTHGFTIDQTAHMCAEWESAPPVEYLVASTIHPHLTTLLLAHQRRLTWFHNFVGIKRPPVQYGICLDCEAMVPDVLNEHPECLHARTETRLENYEDWMYMALYPGTVRAGSGLNAVTRAIDVALFMGFARIIVLGADCCLRVRNPLPEGVVPGTLAYTRWLNEEVVMHADGSSALSSGATPVTLQGMIDGRRFLTKPDMSITAVWLEVMRRKLKGRLEVIGDGLPNALRNKSLKYLNRLPALVDSRGRPMQINL